MLQAAFREVEPSLVADVDAPAWRDAPAVRLDRTWRGEPAPQGVETWVRLIWTREALWLAFTCRYLELDVDEGGDPRVERHGLWERDVCEAFIQSPFEPTAESYKEFEVAPSGQWFDVAVRTPRLDVDWQWNGAIDTAAAVDRVARVWRAVVRVPFAALGGAPRPGDAWRANLFRIGRAHGDRHYLAFAPTGTPAPDFHVPGAFTPLVFDGPAADRRGYR